MNGHIELKEPETIQLRQSITSPGGPISPLSPGANHRISISVADLPPVPKPSGQLTSETQQPRWWLRVQAMWWRGCMRLGMRIHDWAPPPPPKPSFHQIIETHTIDGGRSTPIDLAFYVPKDYEFRKRQGHRYPVVVNYHGGGFVLGSNIDDRYWFRVVLQETPAIVVSVGYRRAPEHPFPTPVDDCVDTLLWLASNAYDLGIDPSKVALSGFSAGANFSFAVPLRLRYHTSSFHHRGRSICGVDSELSRFDSTKRLLATSRDLNVVSIVAWYPLVDFATPRDDKRGISLKPEKTMPKFFTNLFDQSYLPGAAGINHSSPYVSPGRASDRMLRDGLPHNIQLYICEYDMLLREGQAFASHLRQLGKNVTETLVKGQPHAWDKSPNPFRKQKEIDRFYSDACANLRQVFEDRGGPAPRGKTW
ncbi:putative catalytic protein [Phaeomoniella chlamydospora]|uniref:Putative catalytic protein n=1 Tax=Phaeomoniella chlamydospora TaxID=158046 RepID=A0A0G2GVD5_PHACM|nr:putative catalytic protein [Phaeomoniella chlamydospora]